MKEDEYIKCCTSKDPNMIGMWTSACKAAQADEDAWVKKLKANNIVAAHPDDGWVDREENFVDMCYPYFNIGIEIGSLIVLGWPEQFRVVRVTSIGTSGPLTETPLYYFTGTSINI